MVVIWVTITFCLPTPNVSWGCEGVQSSSALFVSFLGISEWLEQGRCNTEVWLSLPCNNCLCSPVFSSTYTNHLLSYRGQIHQGPFYLSETFGEALPCDTNCTEEPSGFFLIAISASFTSSSLLWVYLVCIYNTRHWKIKACGVVATSNSSVGRFVKSC